MQIKKELPVQLYNMKGKMDGPTFAFGKVGSGKSVSLLSTVQGYHDNYNYKIFDIFGGERHEQVFWAIPSQETSYWNKIYSIAKFNEPGPKQYKVHFLYPYFKSKLPKKLPIKKDKDNNFIVKSDLFTIPWKDITTEDINMVIGLLSETSKYAFNEIMTQTSRNSNPGDLIYKANKIKGVTNTPFYKNFLLPLMRENFIMDSFCDYNLDIIEESKDREVITVLCLEFVPKQYHLLIINYILRKLSDALDQGKTHKRNIVFFREASTFFKATEDSVMEDRFKMFRTFCANYIRMGRRGCFFFLDTQSPSETRGIVEGSTDYVFIFRMTSFRDKNELCDELKKERRMKNMQIAELGFLKPGVAYVAEVARHVRKIQFILPRTMFWKREYANFYTSLWDRFEGKWQSIQETEEYIDTRIKINTEKLRLKDPRFINSKDNINMMKESDIEKLNSEQIADLYNENTINQPAEQAVANKDKIVVSILPNELQEMKEKIRFQEEKISKKPIKKVKVSSEVMRLLDSLPDIDSEEFDENSENNEEKQND